MGTIQYHFKTTVGVGVKTSLVKVEITWKKKSNLSIPVILETITAPCHLPVGGYIASTVVPFSKGGLY